MGALHSPSSPDGSPSLSTKPWGSQQALGWAGGGGGPLGCLGTPQAKCTSSSQAAHIAHCHCGSKARPCHSSLQPCSALSPVVQNSILAMGRKADFRLTKPGKVAVR